MLSAHCAHPYKIDQLCACCVTCCLFRLKAPAALSFTSASYISINLQRHIYGIIMQNERSDWHQSFMLHSEAFFTVTSITPNCENHTIRMFH